jgi:hypothetical protein
MPLASSIETSIAVISWALDKQVILQHLFCHEVWQEALIKFIGHLHVIFLFASNFQLRKNTLRIVVVSSAVNTLCQENGLAPYDSFDGFAL